MINTVVFDLGNVLIPWNIAGALGQFFSSSEAIQDFLQEIDFSTWHMAQDAGFPIAEATEQLCARFPQHAAPIRAIYSRWNDSLGAPIAGTVALLHELKAAGIRCYALSNFSAELFDRSKPDFDFWPAFDGIVLSGEEGVNKPDARLYKILFERYAIDPKAALFIDDMLPNIEAAAALGMQGIHFEDATLTRHILRDWGLPV